MLHLLRTADLTPAGVRHVVDPAADLRRDPHRGAGELAGRSVELHRAPPSTRVRLTFSAAAERLALHRDDIAGPDAPAGDGRPPAGPARSGTLRRMTSLLGHSVGSPGPRAGRRPGCRH